MKGIVLGCFGDFVVGGLGMYVLIISGVLCCIMVMCLFFGMEVGFLFGCVGMILDYVDKLVFVIWNDWSKDVEMLQWWFFVLIGGLVVLMVVFDFVMLLLVVDVVFLVGYGDMFVGIDMMGSILFYVIVVLFYFFDLFFGIEVGFWQNVCVRWQYGMLGLMDGMFCVMGLVIGVDIVLFEFVVKFLDQCVYLYL